MIVCVRSCILPGTWRERGKSHGKTLCLSLFHSSLIVSMSISLALLLSFNRGVQRISKWTWRCLISRAERAKILSAPLLNFLGPHLIFDAKLGVVLGQFRCCAKEIYVQDDLMLIELQDDFA